MDNANNKIKFLRVMYLKGANIWTCRPVIEVWVDIGEFESMPSHVISGFNERLIAWLPSLLDHQCGVHQRGGFLQRLYEGTWVGHILEHVVLELQTLAGMYTSFGQTRSTSQCGVYKMVFHTRHEMVGRAALEIGRELLVAAIENHPFDIDSALKSLRQQVNSYFYNQETIFFEPLANNYGIPLLRSSDVQPIQLGHGCQQQRLAKPYSYEETRQTMAAYFHAKGNGRVPIIGIVGTQQTSLIARLVSWLLLAKYQSVGSACAEGVFLNHQRIGKIHDDNDWDVGQMLLSHPDLQVLVFVSTYNMVLTQGLPYDLCDVAVITDAEGYQALDEFYIRKQDQLYHVLSTQLEVLKHEGTAIIQAHDPLLIELAEKCKEKVIMYAKNEEAHYLDSHRQRGGHCVLIRNNRMIDVVNDSKTNELLSLHAVSAELQAQPASVLAAIAAVIALDISFEDIKERLINFQG